MTTNTENEKTTKNTYKKRANTMKNDKKSEKNEKPKEKPKEKRKRSFRIAAKSFLLTYPKCPLSPDFIAEYFKVKYALYGVKDYLISREKHEDGSPHIHAFLCFEKKVDTTDQRFFDINYQTKSPDDPKVVKEEASYHGNYSGAKKETSSIEYVTKHILTNEDALGNLAASPYLSKQLGAYYEYLALEKRMILLAKNGEVEEAMHLLEREDPKKFLVSGRTIRNMLETLFFDNMGLQQKYDLSDFIITEDLQNALNIYEHYFRIGESKVIIIRGDTACGKTKFLIAYFLSKGYEPLIIHDMHGLEEFRKTNYTKFKSKGNKDKDGTKVEDKDGSTDNKDKDGTKAKGHGAIIMDDMDFSNLEREQIIALMQDVYSQIHVRYKNCYIPGDIPRAITTNKRLEELSIFFRDPAIQRRIIVYNVPPGDKLFDDTKPKENETPEEREKREEKIKLDEELENYRRKEEERSKDYVYYDHSKDQEENDYRRKRKGYKK